VLDKILTVLKSITCLLREMEYMLEHQGMYPKKPGKSKRTREMLLSSFLPVDDNKLINTNCNRNDFQFFVNILKKLNIEVFDESIILIY